ncbi:hypothetical protein F0562_006208 [Nyssa sinensis]|uniref:Uncharacterized protein n=1 Tax=Nyssa sinensis TaxID=561372 RepID=A0A5J5AMJ0_9ASTE|nr:hypothetical protein F0562_006208 [Nyssa sinensis]
MHSRFSPDTMTCEYLPFGVQGIRIDLGMNSSGYLLERSSYGNALHLLVPGLCSEKDARNFLDSNPSVIHIINPISLAKPAKWYCFEYLLLYPSKKNSVSRTTINNGKAVRANGTGFS